MKRYLCETCWHNLADRKMRAGDRLFVFENTFYQNLIKTVQGHGELSMPYTESERPAGGLQSVGSVSSAAVSQNAATSEQSMASLEQSYRVAREKERLALVAEVLNFADVIRIELDGEIVAFLPFFDVMTLGDVVDILGGLPTDLSTELAFLTEHRSTEQPMAVNLGAADYIRLKP